MMISSLSGKVVVQFNMHYEQNYNLRDLQCRRERIAETETLGKGWAEKDRPSLEFRDKAFWQVLPFSQSFLSLLSSRPSFQQNLMRMC